VVVLRRVNMKMLAKLHDYYLSHLFLGLGLRKNPQMSVHCPGCGSFMSPGALCVCVVAVVATLCPAFTYTFLHVSRRFMRLCRSGWMCVFCFVTIRMRQWLQGMAKVRFSRKGLHLPRFPLQCDVGVGCLSAAKKHKSSLCVWPCDNQLLLFLAAACNRACLLVLMAGSTKLGYFGRGLYACSIE
jgi:hypothetical protein